jgi:hypothetical protein
MSSRRPGLLLVSGRLIKHETSVVAFREASHSDSQVNVKLGPWDHRGGMYRHTAVAVWRVGPSSNQEAGECVLDETFFSHPPVLLLVCGFSYAVRTHQPPGCLELPPPARRRRRPPGWLSERASEARSPAARPPSAARAEQAAAACCFIRQPRAARLEDGRLSSSSGPQEVQQYRSASRSALDA